MCARSQQALLRHTAPCLIIQHVFYEVCGLCIARVVSYLRGRGALARIGPQRCF